MEMLSGAEMIVRSLINQKVEQVFGYPGGAILDIYDALERIGIGIHHVLVRHEQSAVHMADGYARATGKTGVVLVTSGPGATNAITGIATAYMDSIPIIIMSGQVPLSLIGSNAFQECDTLGITRSIVKHSFLIKNTHDIPTILKKSFFIARTGRPGPVLIDLPKDILSKKTKSYYIWPKAIKINSCNINIPLNINQIKIALNKLLQSDKPVIYAGGGAINSNCSLELLKLAEILKIPVTTSLMGLGVFPGTHNQNIGMLGMHGTYEANMAMHNSDVILGIGVRFDDRTTNNLNKYCPNATIIHIDIDPKSISKTISADIPIIGDAKKILKRFLCFIAKEKQKLTKHQQLLSCNKWWDLINKWRKRKCLHFNCHSTKIKPQIVIQKIWQLTKGDAYVTSDVGQHQMFTALYYLFDKPRRWINSGGLGTMGFGLPAALGVKIAIPNKIVICITGDGSIQMNIQELSTALQYNLPILIVNLNNQCLGMVKQWQDMIYSGRHSQSYMKSLPNFVRLVESYGHVGISITNLAELEIKLKEALKILMSGHLVFIDIMVDSNEHVYPMQIQGGGMNEMWLSKNEKT